MVFEDGGGVWFGFLRPEADERDVLRWATRAAHSARAVDALEDALYLPPARFDLPAEDLPRAAARLVTAARAVRSVVASASDVDAEVAAAAAAAFGTTDLPERLGAGAPFSDANGAVRAEAVRIFRTQMFESGGG